MGIEMLCKYCHMKWTCLMTIKENNVTFTRDIVHLDMIWVIVLQVAEFVNQHVIIMWHDLRSEVLFSVRKTEVLYQTHGL